MLTWSILHASNHDMPSTRPCEPHENIYTQKLRLETMFILLLYNLSSHGFDMNLT